MSCRMRKWAAICVFLAASGAYASDEVMMATSEDLGAFDAQLGSAASARNAGAKTQSQSNFGATVSAEAKLLKDSGSKTGFGQKVRGLAPGQGMGASASSNRSGSGAANSGKAVGKKIRN